MIRLKIDKKEVLRYLRYHGQAIDSAMDNLIDDCITEVKRDSMPNYIYKVFDIQKKDKNILLENTILTFRGNDIYNHLVNSEKCVLMAATLGSKIDRQIKYYSKFDMTKCLILDACATTAIEALCDEVEEEVKEVAKNEGYYITSRYSPGYGDFNIEMQPKLLNTLNTQVKIGLTVTDSLILIPRKSVTAVIGLSKQECSSKPLKCNTCNNYENCMYVREGEVCGI